MMKLARILTTLTAVFTVLAGPSIANAAFPPGHAIIGVDVGYQSRSGKLNSDYFATAATPLGLPVGTPIVSTINKLSDSGTTLGILGGYQFWYNNMFLGLEGHVDWGRYENVKLFTYQTVTPAGININGDATYIQGTRYGITARFGMKVPPFFMPYVRIGAEYSEHEVSLNNFILVAAPPNTPSDHYSEVKGLWTWLFGAGIEVPFFSDKTSLRLEYNYLPGTDFGFSDGIERVAGSHDIKVRTHVGKLAWTWNFN